MIASDIIGVQPMQLDATITTHDDLYNAYPYSVVFPYTFIGMLNTKKMDEITDWATNTFTSGSVSCFPRAFHFRNSSDRTLFMLRWS